jgi:hypothetical protein
MRKALYLSSLHDTSALLNARSLVALSCKHSCRNIEALIRTHSVLFTIHSLPSSVLVFAVLSTDTLSQVRIANNSIDYLVIEALLIYTITATPVSADTR